MVLFRYFPEKQGFRAFGDPFERKKQLQEEKRTEAIRAKEEAERLAMEKERAEVEEAVKPDSNNEGVDHIHTEL